MDRQHSHLISSLHSHQYLTFSMFLILFILWLCNGILFYFIFCNGILMFTCPLYLRPQLFLLFYWKYNCIHYMPLVCLSGYIITLFYSTFYPSGTLLCMDYVNAFSRLPGSSCIWLVINVWPTGPEGKRRVSLLLICLFYLWCRSLWAGHIPF